MIKVENITKVYGKKANRFEALSGVSFKIPEHSSIAIIGKSGSGKSTLMHLVSGLDSVSSGKVLIDDKDLSKMKRKELDYFRSHEMSFIFQSFFVRGNESCYENVSLPLEIAKVKRKNRKELILKALDSVDLLAKVKQKAKDLSGGQKQRLAIARAIVNSPKILFADEPTGNLDSNTGELIEELLFDYVKNNGATLIIVTHDKDLANKCDYYIEIKDGKIIDQSEETRIENA